MQLDRISLTPQISSMARSIRLSDLISRRSREAARRRRERPLHLESLEPRLPLATGMLSTLVSIVDDSNTNLLAAMSADRAVSVTEGTAITASVKLTRRPDAPVRILFSSSGPLEIGVGTDVSAIYVPANDLTVTPPLVFNRTNWNVPQTVSIRSIEDGVSDGDRSLPVRYSVATAGRGVVTKDIWIDSRDSGFLTPTIAASGSFKGSLAGPGSSGTVAATYGVNKGTATFRVTSSQLANVRDRVIAVDYVIDSANKVVVQAIRGFNPVGVKLDLTYRVVADRPGLFGVLTLVQPALRKQATLRITAAFVTPGMPRLDGYAPVTASRAAVGGIPAAIAVGADGTAWVANPALNSVQRLVRLAGLWTIADTVTVGKGAKAIAVAPDGSAWVANADDNTIQQIVKKDGVWMANTPIAVAANPAAVVAAKDSAVWVASSNANVVQRIASVNGVPYVTATLPVGTGTNALAVAKDGAIWGASTTASTVQRISSVGNGWMVGVPIAVGMSPSSISAAADGSIWVASAATSSLQRVVRAGGAWRPQAAVTTAGAPTDIAAHPDGSVWVAAGDAIQRFVPTRTGWALQSPVTVGGTIAAIRSAPDGTLLVADAQTAIVTALSAVPSPVRNLAVAPTGIGMLTLTWNAPVTGVPTSYTVTMTTTTASGTSSQTLVASTPSVEYSGLSPSNAYAFSVAASNNNGSGPAATASFAPVEDVASQPLALSAVFGGPGSGEVVLTWQPPFDDAGSSVISYTATVYQFNREQTVTTTSTSCTFSGLAIGDAPLLFRLRATTFAGNGLPASLAVAADGKRLPLPPSNPFMGLEGTSTMHANASSSDATIFTGPGTTDLEFKNNFTLNATVPSVLMSENGGLVCVGVGTTAKNAQTPIVMLVSPKTLAVLDQIQLIKPQSGNLAGGLYNYLDHQNRLVLVNAAGVMQWYSNNYDRTTDTGTLTLEKSVDIGQPMVVGLVPDYEGRIWFATQGSLSANQPPAVMGYYDPQTGATQTYSLPSGEMVANSISSSPAGVAVATTTTLSLFTAATNGTIQRVWQAPAYENSGVRKPGQLSPGTGSTPVFFGPTTGYEYLVITDNATLSSTDNATPAENVNVYSVADGTLVAQTGFLTSTNSGTENAPIAVGNRVFVPSSYGYWYPPPSETPSNSVPSLQNAPFAGGFQGMTLSADGTSLQTTWGPANTIPSSALPRLSLTDNLIYTVLANSTTQGTGPATQTTVSYSFAAISADTGAIVGTPLPLGSNTFSGSYPSYLNTSSYTWNTLQMTGVISPSGVFYQGTAAGLVMVRRKPAQ